MIRNQVFLALALLLIPSASLKAEATAEVLPDTVYGHKDGLALTFDVFTPKEKANGAGVLFMVSGGWYSRWSPPEQMKPFVEPLTKKGFTVFTVRHGSSPRYSIPEAVSDVRRSVRFIRLNSDRFKIDPNRIGVYGMSAGGHLSLMLGTASDNGKSEDMDPVERVTSRVQAVVAFVAPTDLTIMVKDAPNRLPAYSRYPALDLDMPSAKDHSPLEHVTPDDAPTLLLVGVKDDLVPVDHSRRIQKSFSDQKVTSKLVEFENAGHGFGAEDLSKAVEQMVNWFEMHLASK